MCKFCGKENTEKLSVSGYYYYRMSISGKSLNITDARMDEDIATEDYIPIKYCPLCGRDLNPHTKP